MTEIRTTHPYGYRSGEWAHVVTVVQHSSGRACFLVRFADGQSDFWPVLDLAAGYEFRSTVRSAA